MPFKLNALLASLSVACCLVIISTQIVGIKAMAIVKNASAVNSLYDIPIKFENSYELLERYGHFMQSIMNQSINPCEDFYEYACGNWKHAPDVPAAIRNESFLSGIQKRLNNLTISYLSNATEEQLKLPTAESKAKLFFNSCLKHSQDMSEGYQQFLKWPEFQNKSYNHTEDWININFASQHAMYSLLPLKISYNAEKRKLIIVLKGPTKILGDEELVDFKNFTRDFHIESEDIKKKLSQELTMLIDFEKNLTSQLMHLNETEELKLGTFLKLHKEDALNWTRFFEVAFNGSAKNEWIIHNTLSNYNELQHFLSQSSLDVMKSYVRWRSLIKFYYIWKAETKDKKLSSKCRQHTEDYFNYALLPWTVENFSSPEQRADVLQVAKPIKQIFYELLNHYSWLDEETRSAAKTKLAAMDIEVGFRDDTNHRHLIDEAYEDVNITSNWFENLEVLERNRAKLRKESVGKAVIPPLLSARVVNAYYASFINKAFMTIGITQLPMYHAQLPNSLKFGGIGNIIAHEMAHGFDTSNYLYNYDGKAQNWWSNSSLRNFQERYRCLEAQYNQYIYKGVATNGNITSPDNIADNVGTRLAYKAYMKTYGQSEADKKPLPGLSLNNKQLFFLKFAQNWCTGVDEEAKLKRIKSDEHAYEEFRVYGTLSNMPEFSDAFSCKLGMDMNPLKKCVVW